MRLLFALLPSALSTLLISSSAFSGNELKLCVGVAPMNNIIVKIREAFEKKSGVKLVLTADPKGNSSETCFKDVDQGVAEAGINAAIWTDLLDIMKEKKYELKSDVKDFGVRTISRDRIQVLTYPKGPKELSNAQLKAVFTGKVTNWKDVGGEDQKIVMILSPKQPTGWKFLKDKVFDGAEMKKDDVQTLPENQEVTEMPKIIAKTPGAVGFGPINLAVDGVNVPKHTTIGRPILIYHKGKPTEAIEKLEAFIKAEGKNLGIAN